MTFGEKIKTARKSKEMTQRQLADLIGAKHNSVSDWENDKNKPDPDTIELLCGVLGVEPNYLFGNNYSDTELDIFEMALSILNWSYDTFSSCDMNANCPLTDDEMIEKLSGGNVPEACENCKFNDNYYYLTDGKKYFELSSDELEELRTCILPYLSFRINQLTEKKKSLSKKEFNRIEYGKDSIDNE